MKILACSDAHDIPGFKNVYTMLEIEKPDLLLSCGDWGTMLPDPKRAKELTGINVIDYGYLFLPILNKVRLLTLYGNHDVLDVLEKLMNLEHMGRSSALIPDIDPVYFNGVKIAGISGNFAWKKRFPWHKTFYEIEHFGYLFDFSDKIKESLANVDIFMTHEAPTVLPGYGTRYGQPLLTDLIRRIKPRIHLSGHVHHAQLAKLDQTTYVNLGMALHGDYAIIDTSDWSVILKRLETDASVHLKTPE